MRNFKITEINKFMGKLLKSETFDAFLLREGTIRTFMEFNYNGELQRDYYDTEEQENLPKEDYVRWEKIRPQAFEVIKGKHTPLLVKLGFVADNELKYKLFPEIGNDVMLNIGFTYKAGTAVIITGFYRNTFSMDKEPERIWDAYVSEFLTNNEIAFEEM